MCEYIHVNTCILRNELKWKKVSVTTCMLLSTEIKKAIIECHFLGLSDTTKNQYPAGNVRKWANASIMWLIFDNVSTTFLFSVALLFPCHMHALMQKNLSREGGGGVWRFLDIISFWCRATDLHLLKRELNFAIKILFILLVDRRWKPKVSLAHLLTEDQLADFFFLVLMANSCSILDFDTTWKTSHT